jgi:hypothetical protein
MEALAGRNELYAIFFIVVSPHFKFEKTIKLYTHGK